MSTAAVTGPAPAARGGSGTAAVLRLFLSRLFSDRQVWLLPVAAFAVVGALALTVAGGAAFFWGLTGDAAGFYRLLSAFAVMFLAAPMVGLAASAAKRIISTAPSAKFGA